MTTINTNLTSMDYWKDMDSALQTKIIDILSENIEDITFKEVSTTVPALMEVIRDANLSMISGLLDDIIKIGDKNNE